MKNLLIAFYCISCLGACTTRDQKTTSSLTPKFDPNGLTYIRVINEAEDSVEVTKFYNTLLGNARPEQWSAKIPPSVDTILILGLGIQQVYSLNLQRNLVNLFLPPGDSTSIHITKVNRRFDNPQFKYYISGENNSDFYFEGNYATENNYLQQKDQRFSNRFAAGLTNDPTVGLSDYAYKIDSFAIEQKTFLDSMNNVLGLKQDFFDIETANIYYSALSSKMTQPSFLSFQLGKFPDTSTGYYEFIDDIDLNVPGGAYNYDYYSLLGALAYHGANNYWEQRIDGFNGKMRKVQDSLVYNYLSKKHSNSDFDPLKTDSLVTADKLSIVLNHFAELRDLISPELFDLLIYNQAKMHASFGTVTQSMISKVVFENTFQGNKYLQLVSYKKGLQKGDLAPYFYLKTMEGGFSELEDFVGKLVYLNFWAPWCKPCMAELPAEIKLAKEIDKDSVQIVNICVHCDEKGWKKTVEEKDMPGIHLFAQGEWTEKLTEGYQNMGIPHYSLIDMEGRIIANPTYRPSDPQLVEFIRSNLPDYGLLK